MSVIPKEKKKKEIKEKEMAVVKVILLKEL